MEGRKKRGMLLLYFFSLFFIQTKGEEKVLFEEKQTTVKKLSVKEVQIIVELLLHELPQFMNEYFKDNKLTWKQWIKKHGFFASLTILSIGLRLYMSVQHNKEGEYNVFAPTEYDTTSPYNWYTGYTMPQGPPILR